MRAAAALPRKRSVEKDSASTQEQHDEFDLLADSFGEIHDDQVSRCASAAKAQRIDGTLPAPSSVLQADGCSTSAGGRAASGAATSPPLPPPCTAPTPTSSSTATTTLAEGASVPESDRTRQGQEDDQVRATARACSAAARSAVALAVARVAALRHAAPCLCALRSSAARAGGQHLFASARKKFPTLHSLPL